jgi:hypothetical protein
MIPGARGSKKNDPPKRSDGRCPCSEEFPEQGVRYNDPFCSAACARQWYGLTASSTSSS